MKVTGIHLAHPPCLCAIPVKFAAHGEVLSAGLRRVTCRLARLGIVFTKTDTMFRAVLLAGGLVVGAVIAAPAAQAESCEAHLAKHGTSKAADIAHHARYGGESPCGYVVDNSSSNDYSDDRRSRWEDKTSFDCGWSWRGGFGC